LEWLFSVDPSGWTELYNKVANDKEVLTRIGINGPVKAKKRGTIKPSDTRTLLPQPAVMQVMHNIRLARIQTPLSKDQSSSGADRRSLQDFPAAK
jgi:hypothetical protein